MKNNSNETNSFWNDLKSGRFSLMLKESSKGESLSGPAEVYHILKPLFAKIDDVEKMFCIFLDAKNNIIEIEEMFSGSITSSMVYPREIVKRLLKLKASAIILAHNHPSGCIDPSTEDHKITAKIIVALASIDVLLHDHIIIGDSFYSFADHGWVNRATQHYTDFISSIKYLE